MSSTAFKVRFTEQKISLENAGKTKAIFARMCGCTTLLYSCKVLVISA